MASGTPGHPDHLQRPAQRQRHHRRRRRRRGIVTLGEYNQTIAYVILQGLTLRNAAWGIDAQNDHDMLIAHNTISDVDNGIVNRRELGQESNQTITDNIITGRTPWPR